MFNAIYNVFSFAAYLSLFSATSGLVPTVLTLTLFVLGRVEPVGFAGSMLDSVPDIVGRFIDLKVYGLVAGLLSIVGVRIKNYFGISRLGGTLSLIFLLNGLLFLLLALADCLWFWLVLSVPFSVGLAMVLVLGPLVILVNIVSIYRIVITVVLWSWGIRDPFVDPGVLGQAFRSMVRWFGPRGLILLSGMTSLVDVFVFGPIEAMTSVWSFFFVPGVFRFKLSRGHLRLGSRFSLSLVFFSSAVFDFEFLFWFIVSFGAATFVAAVVFLSSVLGVETMLDFLFPNVVVWVSTSGLLAGFTVSTGTLWLLGRIIEKHGLEFNYVDADGKAACVNGVDTLYEAPPHVRRDILMSYASLFGVGRFLLGLGVVVSLLLLSTILAIAGSGRRRIYLVFSVCVRGLALATIPWMVPDAWIDVYSEALFRLEFLWGPFWVVVREDGYKWVRFFWAILGWVHTMSTRVSLDIAVPAERPRISALFFEHALSLTRRSVLKFVEAANDVRLPEFVSNVYEPPSIESITRAYELLADVGFPVTRQTLDTLTNLGEADVSTSSYLAEHGSWRKWFLGRINLGLGYPRLKVSTHPWLPKNFYEAFPGYLHVASWTGEEPEVRSTARYWTGNEAQEIPNGGQEPLVDDLWEAVRVQYEGSRLATFKEIYSGWVKKYNMGFLFLKEVNGKRKQLTRNEVIQMMGGKRAFLEAWERLFNKGLGVHMPAPVFAKYESLKPKKALEKSVRTILGSPFVHHVMSTVFNYHPNHNYKVWETPMKVGMPINGQNYNRLWESLMRHDKVWAGDMTAFDSTQSPAMLRVCAAIRKAGYELHKDRSKICELIDISYEALIQQPLGFKNTGDIAWKNQGATTGHSSTSSDNSLMLVANYLFAWRRVTGLRAREFFNYNTLANFGDDHVLGYDPVFGWCPERMIAAMAELGTVMRDEAPGETKLPALGQDFNKLNFAFLAKVPVPLSSQIKAELQRAGVDVPLTYATAHVRHRLLGKVKGEHLVGKTKDPLRSYNALISYIYMSAHHQDIYRDLIAEARHMWEDNVATWRRQGLVDVPGRKDRVPTPPTYNKVLRTWYSKEPFPYTAEGEEADDDHIYVHLQDDILGMVVRWMADVPTLLSPRYLNTRWADWLQIKLAWALSWPVSFVALANGTTLDPSGTKLLVQKTPYAFLRNDALVPSLAEPYGVLLTRHLTFTALSRMLGVRKSVSVLDFVRLADASWANFVFLLTGRVTMVVLDLDLHIVDTLLVLVVSYISFDCKIPVLDFDVLSPSLILARIMSAALRLITPSGAIDYQPLDEQVRHLALSSAGSFVLEAPTGTGKSTRMMARIRSRLPSSLKMVVIQPRHLVTKGVGEYMKKLYPATGIGISTEGYELSGNESLIYSTVQSFLLNKTLRVDRNIVLVIDEAHLNEVHYHVIRRLAVTTPTLRKIFVTATPTPDLLAAGFLHIAVPAVSQNKVHEVEHEILNFKAYKRFATLYANDRLPVEKTLIFCPSILASHEIASGIVHPTCVLNSANPNVDESASVFIATSVADAGLTIPDVSSVLSMDYDVQVTTPDFNGLEGARVDADGVHQYARDGWQPRPYYFRLPEVTKTQRKGRTGRTLDGVFHYFRVMDVKVEPVTFSLSDYANGLKPASSFAVRWFPQTEIKANPLVVPFMNVWDQVPRTDWTRFMAWSAEFRRVSRDHTPKAFLGWLKANLDRIKQSTRSGQLTVLPPDELPAPWIPDEDEPVTGLPKERGSDDEDQSAAQDLNQPLPIWRPPIGVPMTRQDVSGQGLYCGVRCAVGLIWSLTDQRPSFDEVYRVVRAGVDTSGLGDVEGLEAFDPNRNFQSNMISDPLWREYRVAFRVVFDDGTNPIEVNPGFDPQERRGDVGLLYQGPNHYNYHGYALPEGVI